MHNQSIDRPRTAFELYSLEARPLISERLYSEADIIIASQWRSLDETSKASYQAQIEAQKRRYDSEKEAAAARGGQSVFDGESRQDEDIEMGENAEEEPLPSEPAATGFTAVNRTS